MDLFEFIGPAPAQRHSRTSTAAGASLAPVLRGWRLRVFGMVREAGEWGVTDDELIRDSGNQSVRPRRIELTQAGLIRDSGRTRITSAGRQAVVWVANDVPCETCNGSGMPGGVSGYPCPECSPPPDSA